MDYEKYYVIKSDGSYLVHFPNKGLTSDEVQNIFSAYGEVLSVDLRRDRFGLCFVRYKTLNQTIDCLRGLKDHKSVKILAHKTKVMQQTNKDKPLNGNFANKKNRKDHLNNTTPRSRTDSYNYEDCNGDKSKINSKDHHNDTSPISEVNCKDNHNNTPFELETCADECKDSIKSESSLRQLLRSKQLRRASSSNSSCSEFVDKSLDTTREKFTNICCKCNQITPTTIKCEEVIVANVHPKLGPQEVLELFKECYPIAISRMFQVPNIGINYYHIYFLPFGHTSTAEKFDKFSWYGRNLIVLRSHVLVEQAQSK